MYEAIRDTSWAFFGDMPWSDGRLSGWIWMGDLSSWRRRME